MSLSPRPPVATDLMTANEARSYLRMGRAAFYALLNAGEIPAYREGSHWRLWRPLLDEWVERRCRAGQPAPAADEPAPPRPTA